MSVNREIASPGVAGSRSSAESIDALTWLNDAMVKALRRRSLAKARFFLVLRP